MQDKNASSAEKIPVGQYPKRKKIENMGDCYEFEGLNFLSFLFGFYNYGLKVLKVLACTFDFNF